MNLYSITKTFYKSGLVHNSSPNKPSTLNQTHTTVYSSNTAHFSNSKISHRIIA